MLDRLTMKLSAPMLVIGTLFIVVIIFFVEQLSKLQLVSLLVLMLLLQFGANLLYAQRTLVHRLTLFKRYVMQVISVEEAPKHAIKDPHQDLLASIINELGGFISNLSAVILAIRTESELIKQGAASLYQQMQQSTQSMEKTTEQIELMAEAIEQVAATSVQLSGNADQVNQTTEQALTLLNQGRTSSNTSQQSINVFANEVQVLATDLSALQEECVRIGKVLDVIRGIAEQTNLLALNAAIEAARAGEQGRGFAVVADEVRALAHRTQQSTVEIQAMVEGLQAKSTNAVSAIDRGQELTQQSLSHSQAVVSAFDQIGAAFALVEQLTSAIAQSIAEQQNSTNTINNNMTMVVSLSHQIYDGLNAVSQHAQAQQNTVAEVDNSLNKICV
jgi:methyl-accepting chemotaxis protein